MKNTGLVFVYGTLKMGGVYSCYFDDFRLKVEDAHIKGEMYDLGNFPGLILIGNNCVYGEIHKYSNFKSVIKLMDQIEGYSEEPKTKNLYERRSIEATTNNGKLINVTVYALADKKLVSLVKEGFFPKVENGIWDL